jgi:hypothetical protein
MLRHFNGNNFTFDLILNWILIRIKFLLMKRVKFDEMNMVFYRCSLVNQKLGDKVCRLVQVFCLDFAMKSFPCFSCFSSDVPLVTAIMICNSFILYSFVITR